MPDSFLLRRVVWLKDYKFLYNQQREIRSVISVLSIIRHGVRDNLCYMRNFAGKSRSGGRQSRAWQRNLCCKLPRVYVLQRERGGGEGGNTLTAYVRCEGSNEDESSCACHADRRSSHKRPRSRLTGRGDLASVFHGSALRVIQHDRDRQIRPWHSRSDREDLRGGGRLPDTMQRGTRADRDRFHRKQRRGLMALRLNRDLKQIQRNVAKRNSSECWWECNELVARVALQRKFSSLHSNLLNFYCLFGNIIFFFGKKSPGHLYFFRWDYIFYS